MSRILLVVPGSRTFYGEPRYPVLGLSMIGAVLLKAGYEVTALDMRFSKIGDEELLAGSADFQPQYVGFTVTNWDVLEAVRLSEKIKSVHPSVKVIFGGPQASLCPLETLQFKEVDVVVCGEGELTIIELLQTLETGTPLSGVSGIGYCIDGKPIVTPARPLIADLSKLPWPAYELFDMARYWTRGERRLGIASTRGCPYGCIFCTGRAVMGRRIRRRPPANVVAEMIHWHRTFSIDHFCFVEDNLLGQPEHGDQLLEEFEQANLPTTYSLEVGVRADALTPDICERLKKTGCTTIAIGIESVDRDVLRLVKKGETLETMSRGIRAAKAAGLFVKGYFIIGLPGDTRAKVEQAVAYARIEEIDMPRFALAQAFPHTELASWVEKHGQFYYNPYEYTLHHTDEFHGDVHYDMPGFSKYQIWRAYRWAHNEAESISFKRALIRRFGRRTGTALNIFNNQISRALVIWLYQHKWISLPG
jgi:anaerobic magnesium-protoporphyrin IX monomethyl ester cyclase